LKFDGEDNREGTRWIDKVENYFDMKNICDEKYIGDEEYVFHVKDHDDGMMGSIP
jgi:hypothetical protein